MKRNRLKRNRLKRIMLAVICGILLLQTSVFADVDKLNINQIIQKGNDVYLYVNALDNSGHASGDTLNADQLSVNINEGKGLRVLDSTVAGQGCSYIFCIDISKSVTDAEMAEIKSSMAEFVNGMSNQDFARIIAIGSDITSVCDSTQDKNALNQAIQGIGRTANDTYLYKGLSFALDGQRKRQQNVPERAAIILFTDGMDDSDGAYTVDQVMADYEASRIPIYVIGLKGNDANASLNAAGQIAQQSGGNIFSYSDMSVTEAMQTVGNIIRSTYQVHVQPKEKNFGKKDLTWRVNFNPGSYSVSSKDYICSLSMDGVAVATKAPKPTATSTPVPTPTVTPVPEKSLTEQISLFFQENMILCIAGVMILIAVIIILIIVLNRKKRFVEESLPQDEDPSSQHLDEYSDVTLDDEDLTADYDDEETIGGDYDNEDTIDGDYDTGIKLQFEITFEGRTETVTHILRDELILGRGVDCDVDVVLNSSSEIRKQTSRKHAVIIDRPDGIYIRDNSRNRTFLNDVEVSGEMPLQNDDVLRMGRAVVKVKILSY